MSTARRRVVVAMSGGVDSSTAAALLHEAGAEVVGVTLKLYDASGTPASIGGRCCGPRDIDDARATAATLGFAHYVLDESEAFRRTVIDDFVQEYRAGRTPNPCVRCNEHLKFGPLVRFARAIGAEALATGHYARLERTPGADPVRLGRAADRSKDQSYFLFGVRAEDLAFVEFPLGDLNKTEVRAAARRLNLPNCDKPESQQICFIPDGDHHAFLEKHGGAGREGKLVDENGAVLATHTGTHRFTVGQRRGLPASANPRFVIRINPATGDVTTGPRDHLRRGDLRVGDCRWLRETKDWPLCCDVQVRHHAQAHPAELSPVDGESSGAIHARLIEPIEGIAAGQAAVFYQNDKVLGGGWVEPESC